MILAFNSPDPAPEMQNRAVAIRFSTAVGVGGTTSRTDQAHADLSLFGQTGREADARLMAFFGSAPSWTGCVTPGDLRIADSIACEMDADGFLD